MSQTISAPPKYDDTEKWAYDELILLQDQINLLREELAALQEELAKSG